MREQEMFCKVSHLLANKTHFLPYVVTKFRATFMFYS